MRQWTCAFLLFLFPALLFAAGKAIVLDVSGPIGPATQDYIVRDIDYAEKTGASVVILRLDTPGGLEMAMHRIDKAIINSSVPVIAFVAPSGARAASAGVFIVYASLFAAMAPGTNIGAATPINLFSSSKEKQLSTAEIKLRNDAAAYIRSLAQLRGRNAAWGELAVTKSVSLSAEEAKRLNVINAIANNEADLLQKANGFKFIVHNQTQTLNTAGLELEHMPTDWRYDFLSFITNPNIAYLLMLIAIYGIFFEFANPGMVLPGVAGIIALLLALYAFQLMPINYTGLTLLFVGIAFMVFEVYVSTFGVIGIGGIIAFILGSILLFDTNEPTFQLALTLVVAMSVITITFFFMILSLAVRSHKRAIITGEEGLIGKEGTVLSVMNKQIVVRVLGEIWDAESSHVLVPEQKIIVTKVQGLLLTVEPVNAKIITKE